MSECADGGGHLIKPGEWIVKREQPSVLEYNSLAGKRTRIVELWYSHVECYRQGHERHEQTTKRMKERS